MKSVSDAATAILADTPRVGEPVTSGTGDSSILLTEQVVHEIAALATLTCDSPLATLTMPGIAVTWRRSGGRCDSAAGTSDSPFDDYVRGCSELFEVPDLGVDERFSATRPVVDGRSVVFYAAAPIIGADRQVLGSLAVLDFIARRLNAEQRTALSALARQAAAPLALRKELVLARGLVESAPVAIYHTDARGHITYSNPEYRRILNLGPEDCLADWAKGVHPDDRPGLEAAWADFCRNPRPVTFGWRSVPRDGVSRVLTEQVVAAQEIDGFVGTITDITERIAARANLKRAETRFRGTFDQAPIGIVYAARDGRVLRANSAFCDLLGFDLREIELKSVAEFTHDADIANNSTEFERLWRGEIEVIDAEKRYVRSDRRAVWVRVTTALIRDENGMPTCAVEFLRDISTRKDLAVALLQNQRLLEAVIADIPAAIIACDVTGDIILHNRAADDLFAIAPADDSRAGTPAPYPIGISAFLPDGITPVPREQRPLARALRGETVTHMELLAVMPGGIARATVGSARQLTGASGECIGAVAVTQDVTQMKTLERELAQAQKLESIGQLSAGIAHEINTPTQFIGDNIRFLQESFQEVLSLAGKLRSLVADHTDGMVSAAPIAAALDGPDVGYLREEIPKAIAQSLEGIDRIAKIVGAMKDFSHPGLEKTPVDLNHSIASTITVASNEWKYVAEVKTDFDPALPLVPVMPGAFNQVILNILVNAAHAVSAAAGNGASAKGTITIITRRAEDWVEILIKDTGCGMPAKIINRIFDPFFTTKPVGKGTGQGLAIAHDVVVKKHGGTIGVDSEPGVGTTFTLRLPLAAASPDAQPVAA
jgi:two-component system, NtrC family, sensor kinase